MRLEKEIVAMDPGVRTVLTTRIALQGRWNLCHDEDDVEDDDGDHHDYDDDDEDTEIRSWYFKCVELKIRHA